MFLGLAMVRQRRLPCCYIYKLNASNSHTLLLKTFVYFFDVCTLVWYSMSVEVRGRPLEFSLEDELGLSDLAVRSPVH